MYAFSLEREREKASKFDRQQFGWSDGEKVVKEPGRAKQAEAGI